MKIKDFLNQNTTNNTVQIYDIEGNFAFTGNIPDAIRRYGYERIKEWTVSHNIIKITANVLL